MSSENAPHLLVQEGDEQRGRRPEQPEAFLRGVAFPGTGKYPYPRAEPIDRMRLPGDTWSVATLPVGARFEIEVPPGSRATHVVLDYVTATDQLGYRGDGAGKTFSSWSDGVGSIRLGSHQAMLGDGAAKVPLSPVGRTIVHLPEGMRPAVTALRGVGDDDGQQPIAPAQHDPLWVVYGDSVAEGWIASEPALAWPAIAGRSFGLAHVNMGYAGAARGETASAEQVAKLPADVITVCHGTNCWTRTPHSSAQMRANTDAFLEILRQEHPDTPIVVASPVVRPDAEATPNRLGATLADLRREMEDVVASRMSAGDEALHLVRGLDVIEATHLGDGIHPDDDGHRMMADVIGAAVRAALDAAPGGR